MAFCPAESFSKFMISIVLTKQHKNFQNQLTKKLGTSERDWSSHLGFDHGFLRIDQRVQECIDAVLLVVTCGSHGLFTHGTLVRVSRRLVVVRIRNETGANAQQSERLDFQMSRVAVRSNHWWLVWI